MENASNALIITGTILIALIILSTGVYLVASYVQTGKAYEKTLTKAEIEKFNSHFIAFEERDNISSQELVTLVKFVDRYKEQTGIETLIICDGFTINTSPINRGPVNTIKTDNPNTSIASRIRYTYYKCKSEDIIYGSDGRITSIRFTKRTVDKAI